MRTPPITPPQSPKTPPLLLSPQAKTLHIGTITPERRGLRKARTKEDTLFEYKHNDYIILCSSHAFALNEQYVYPGLSSGTPYAQEHIIVDTINDKRISSAINQYINALVRVHKNNEDSHPADSNTNLKLILSITSSLFRNNSVAETMDHAIKLNQQGPTIPLYPDHAENAYPRAITTLGDWAEMGMGICRHINLMAFLLLGHAAAHNLLNKAKVYAIQSDMPFHGSAHMVVGYHDLTTNQFLILDFATHKSLSFKIMHPDNEKGIYDLMHYFGFKEENIKADQNRYYGGVYYVLDILARFDLPIHLPTLFDKIEHAGLEGFFFLAGKMKPRYFTWLMQNANKLDGTEPVLKAIRDIMMKHQAENLNSDELGMHILSLDFKMKTQEEPDATACKVKAAKYTMW